MTPPGLPEGVDAARGGRGAADADLAGFAARFGWSMAAVVAAVAGVFFGAVLLAVAPAAAPIVATLSLEAGVVAAGVLAWRWLR